MLNIPELDIKNKQFENGKPLTKNSFRFLTQLGTGAFGKVYKVSSVKTHLLYALKVLSKN